jgi:Trk-type K+ transport system membrane component
MAPLNSFEIEGPMQVRSINTIRRVLAGNFTFFWFHFSYFVILGLFGGIIIYLIEGTHVDFVDCLFMAFSACCITGIVGAEFTRWKVPSQVILAILAMLGSHVLMSVLPVIIRQRFYREKFLEHQRNEVKGYRHEVEYKALTIVKSTALVIFASVHVIGLLVVGLYMSQVESRRQLCEKNDVNPWWFSFFHVVNAFNNSGLSLFFNNMVQFSNDVPMIIFTAILVFVGDPGYPLLMRFVIYIRHKRDPNNVALKYLLKNPRRCCTHMFSGIHTRIIGICLCCFIVLEFCIFLGLDWNKQFMQSVPPGQRVLIAFAQSSYTRTAGFNVVTMSKVAPGMLIAYCVMMYVSSYPITAALRRVSEEKHPDSDDEDEGPLQQKPVVPRVMSVESIEDELAGPPEKPSDNQGNTWSQIKTVLTDDLWMLVVAVFAICSGEDNLLRKDPNVNIFGVLFEVTSAYGTVGFSIGYPGHQSLTSILSAFSKFVIILVMLVGRQRGLPRSIDRAVYLPGLLGVPANRRYSIVEQLNSQAANVALAEITAKLKQDNVQETLRRVQSAPDITADQDGVTQNLIAQLKNMLKNDPILADESSFLGSPLDLPGPSTVAVEAKRTGLVHRLSCAEIAAQHVEGPKH